MKNLGKSPQQTKSKSKKKEKEKKNYINIGEI